MIVFYSSNELLIGEISLKQHSINLSPDAGSLRHQNIKVELGYRNFDILNSLKIDNDELNFIIPLELILMLI